MRQAYHVQGALLVRKVNHSRADELEVINLLLARHPLIGELARQDLLRGGASPSLGASGMSGEQAVRALVLKQMTGLSFRALSEALADSLSFQRFYGLGLGDTPPSKSTLQENVAKLRAETLEQINRVLVRHAQEAGLEDGQKVRGDCTVVRANVHHPTDSSLLADAVRVLVAEMKKARKAKLRIGFTNHRRCAKRRALAIANVRGKEKRKAHYRELLRVTEVTIRYAVRALELLRAMAAVADTLTSDLQRVADRLAHFIPLALAVVDQARRRVIDGQSVPAADKVVSLFEHHTDIIRKDNRETYYGHKLYLTVGKSSLVLDAVVEKGNPADAGMVKRAIERLVEICGRAPKQAAFDGAFASKANVQLAKELGVVDICFAKRRGIAVSDMVRSTWIYKQLRRFRAGVEGCISFLKRAFGLGRCDRRGFDHFKAYVWSSVVSSNLLIIARKALGP